jgi:hypothetical protein
MIKIAISVEAFEAIARTLPLGSLVWLSPPWSTVLRAMRAPVESVSDVILRLVAAAGNARTQG